MTGSLLDLPTLGLGSSDYIDCCGVLHHLADPPAGLAALTTGAGAGWRHGHHGLWRARAHRRLSDAGDVEDSERLCAGAGLDRHHAARGCARPAEAAAGHQLAAPQSGDRRSPGGRRRRAGGPAAAPAGPRLHGAGAGGAGARRGSGDRRLHRAVALRSRQLPDRSQPAAPAGAPRPDRARPSPSSSPAIGTPYRLSGAQRAARQRSRAAR